MAYIGGKTADEFAVAAVDMCQLTAILIVRLTLHSWLRAGFWLGVERD